MIKYQYLPYKRKLTALARQMRENPTAAERKIWYEILRGSEFKFTRQKPIAHYIVDFYCSELGLVIEIDGFTHIGESAVEYDNNRSADLEALGLKVLRFWNDDVLSGIDVISEIINKEIKKIYNPLYPPYQGDNMEDAF